MLRSDVPKMLQVRNVPDDVHETLKRRAAEASMTLSAYVLRELDRLAARPTMDETFDRVRAGGGSVSFEEAAEAIRAVRDGRSTPR